jgi:hypothetical protein
LEAARSAAAASFPDEVGVLATDSFRRLVEISDRAHYPRAVTLGGRLAVSLAALMAAGGLASGCGGDGEQVMRATLTDNGCSYEGDTTPERGLFTVEVRNETLRFANFMLWELAEGVKPEKIEALYAQARREYEQTGALPKQHLPLKRPISNSLVDPEASGALPANEAPGRYVVLCAVMPNTDTRQASASPGFFSHVYAAVELDVRPTS